MNYRADIFALKEIGVRRILATNAVGAINCKLKPGDVVIPHDFIDFTKFRQATYYDKAPVVHIDVSGPYCPELRELLIENTTREHLHVWGSAVSACTEGPRFETPAEIEMFKRLGCDVVSMTSFPEVVLARELGICYASLCCVSNKAAGMHKRLSATEVSRTTEQILPRLEKVLMNTIEDIPATSNSSCSCADALKDARFK